MVDSICLIRLLTEHVMKYGRLGMRHVRQQRGGRRRWGQRRLPGWRRRARGRVPDEVHFLRRDNRLPNELHEGARLRHRHHRRRRPPSSSSADAAKEDNKIRAALLKRDWGEEFVTSLSGGGFHTGGGGSTTINNTAARPPTRRLSIKSGTRSGN